jgi:hypothetical protein
VDAAEKPPAASIRQRPLMVVAVGIGLTLVGLIGDLSTRIAASGDHREELLSFGQGANGWHFMMFVGIVAAAGGAAWAAFDIGTRTAKAVGTAMTALAVAIVLLGTLAGVKATYAPQTSAAPRVQIVPAALPAATSKDIGHHHAAGHAGHAAIPGEGGAVFAHHHEAPGPVSAAQRVVLNQQLAIAKRATAKYRNIAVAKRDGYFQVTQFIPGLGLHMYKLGIPTGTFNPATPQVLLYQPVGNKMVLVGVSYLFIHVNDTPPQGFAGGSDVWHFHRDLCFVSGTVTITTSAADCPGVFQKTTNWMLHVWIWKTNPDGVFTEVNPRVT